MRFAALAAALALTGCSTTIYEGGERIARIQSDAQGLSYTRSPDGAVSLTAETLSNSGPVLAVGKALAPAVLAVGTTAALNATTDVVNVIRRPVP